jgi:uncharacterized membrane protein YGL010W
MTTDPLSQPLLADYGTYHHDARNRLCHELGIPLIVLSLIVFMRLAHYGPFDLAQLAIVAVSFYYAALVRGAALSAIVGLVVLYALSTLVAWPVAIGLFAIGWVLQFAGHSCEGKNPAFLKNVVYLLIGPLWVAIVLTRRGRKQAD